MTTMIAEVYNAFLKSGVPEEDARLAASALSNAISNDHLVTKTDFNEFKIEIKAEITGIKADIARLEKELKTDIARLDKGQFLMRWMTGYVIALLTAIAIKLFI